MQIAKSSPLQPAQPAADGAGRAGVRGFTLVELLMSMAITAILMTVLVAALGTSENMWRSGSNRAEVQAGIRGALALMNRELQAAVIDLDLGFRIERENNEANRFKVVFLTRAGPSDGVSGVRKVCYQTAWASTSVLPGFRLERDDQHPVPVLIRTVGEIRTVAPGENEKRSNPFEVSVPGQQDLWTREWPDLDSPEAGDVTEVVAEYVLGFIVSPVEWNPAAGASVTVAPDDPDHGAQWYDRYLTSDIAPRALRLRLALLPSSAVPPIANDPAWDGVRDHPGLFASLEDIAGEDLFNRTLRRYLQRYEATVYLHSKTP